MDAGVGIRFYETPISAIFREGAWYVNTMGKGIQTQIKCNQLIDCTGNAFVTALAGFQLLREEEIQPGTLQFRISGYDLKNLDLKTIRMQYDKAVKNGRLVKEDFRNNIEGLLNSAGDNIQHIADADSTNSESNTIANIKGRTSLLNTLRFLRELPGCENIKLISMQPETGIRETYRINGEYQMTHEDYVTGKSFDDAISYSFYPIDLHDKHGIIPKHLTENTVASVPLRALIPKNSRNLLVAGRSISSDHLANSALRVQASCMAMGQAAACAAVLAKKME